MSTEQSPQEPKRRARNPKEQQGMETRRTTPQPKKRTGQRTATPQKEGEVQERERRRRRWPDEAVEEGDREGEEPWRKTSRQQEGESRSDEMEEPPTDVQPKDERTRQKTGED